MHAGRHNGLTIYARPDVLISALDGQGFLIGAARTEAAFDRLIDELGFSPF